MDYAILLAVLLVVFWGVVKIIKVIFIRKVVHWSADSLSEDYVTVQNWDEDKQHAYNQERIALGYPAIAIAKKK
jgi:hypothetical protein